MAAYAASKFGVVGYVESLHKELRGTGVRVLCVCPPGVATPMLDTIIASGAMPPRAVRWVKPIGADRVVAAVEAALRRRGQLFVFPGLGSTSLWRLRRWAPGLTNRLMSLFYGA